MKKKVIAGIILSLSSIAGTVMAAPPVDNFNAGKVSVEVGTAAIPAINFKNNEGYNHSDDAKRKIMGGATVGLGHNLALQYRYDDTRLSALAGIDKVDLVDREYNVVYKVNENVNVYAGEYYSVMKEVFYGYTLPDNDRHILQTGVQYHQQIAKNTTGWIDAGFGKDLQHYEIGAAYAINKNIDVDLSYKYDKVSNFTNDNSTWRGCATKQGLYTGITFKF